MVVPGPVFRGLLSRGRVCALRPWLFPLCSKLLPDGLDYLLRRADIDQSDTEADSAVSFHPGNREMRRSRSIRTALPDTRTHYSSGWKSTRIEEKELHDFP